MVRILVLALLITQPVWAQVEWNTRVGSYRWSPTPALPLENDPDLELVQAVNLVGGAVCVAPIWLWTQPVGLPGATDVPFSEQGSATLFVEVAVSPASFETVTLVQEFFPAIEMTWKDDCKPYPDQTHRECYVREFTETSTTLILRSEAEILVVPDVRTFNSNQNFGTGEPPEDPKGSGEFTLVALELDQRDSFPKDFFVSGRPYNATWFLRSTGRHCGSLLTMNDNPRLVGFEIGFTYTQAGQSAPTTDYLGGATTPRVCSNDPGCGTDFKNCFSGCTNRQEGCSVHLRLSGNEPGTASLYLNNPASLCENGNGKAFDPDAPFTPYSFSFNPGSLTAAPTAWDAEGCNKGSLADGMNSALCKPTPEGSWTFALTTSGNSGPSNSNNDGFAGLSCAPGVSCMNSRASASLFIDGMMLTAGEGTYLAPVYDSLSPNTTWKWLRWDLELNMDPAGEIRTPVSFQWRVDDDIAQWPASAIASSTAFNGSFTPNNAETDTITAGGGLVFSATTTGQYFQYQAELSSWDENALNPPPPKYVNEPNCLNPAQNECYPSCLRYSMEYDGSIRPELKKIQVCYEPDAGRFVSALIHPARMRGWSQLTYGVNGDVTVDVLDEINKVVFDDVGSGFSLSGLDPGAYPALKVRFTLKTNGGVGDPCVNWFKVEYEPMEECLALNRNVIRLSRGERVKVRFCTGRAGMVEVKVHDVAGQMVRQLFRSEIQAGEVFQESWDGASSLGAAVAPGVYFVTVVTPSGRKTARLAVAN